MKSFKNILLIIFLPLLLSSFMPSEKSISTGKTTGKETVRASEINWYSFKEATELKNSDKKYFIFVHTDWCSWCKKMKSTTFQDEKVIKLLNEDFIPVTFNAESKAPIEFQGREFKFIQNGSRGYHELAGALLNNRLSYPSIVFLDENMQMIQPLPGYKSADDLSIILTFLADEIYKEMDFEEYYNQQTGEG